jgi:hypothetical protein
MTDPSFSFTPSVRYPDPRVEVLDERFLKLRLFSATVEQLATGLRWAEGPVWFGDGRYLLVSDIPNDRILRWDEASGTVSEFRRPANNANGNFRDRQGRLLTCEHLTRRVTRTEYDGSITVLADRFDGKRLNSPNDIVCARDGSIWFTDPTFGIHGYWEGEPAQQELPHAVYRIAPDGHLQQVLTDLDGPNGLAFSPDETQLYVPVEQARRGRRAGARRARWLPRRCRRQPVVRLGQQRRRRCRPRRAGRRARVRPRRHGDRPHPPARALRQRLLRRPPPQPPVHGSKPFVVRALPEYPGRGLRLGCRGCSQPTQETTCSVATSLQPAQSSSPRAWLPPSRKTNGPPSRSPTSSPSAPAAPPTCWPAW